MKRGYKKLLFFEFVLFCVLIINSFVWNILSDYVMIFFLLVLLFLFRMIFGIEKGNYRYTKDIILEVFIFLIVFFILYYLLGIAISFAKTNNYYTLSGIRVFIIPLIGYILLRELFRYRIMCKVQGNKFLILITVLLFVMLDISTSLYYQDFSSGYEILVFCGLTLLPSISNNIVFSYITLKNGYLPIIIYALVMNLYPYLFPIIPNPNIYLGSVIHFIVPVILGYRVYLFYLKEQKRRIIDRNYSKKNSVSIIIFSAIVILLVYFTSGYFQYWAIAVATGSMHPVIKKGDVVIIEKLNQRFDTLKVGDVIAFRYHNVVIVHRLVHIIKDHQKYYFYTKGDANLREDSFVIEEDMVIGIVYHKISYVGMPTVWFHEHE